MDLLYIIFLNYILLHIWWLVALLKQHRILICMCCFLCFQNYPKCALVWRSNMMNDASWCRYSPLNAQAVGHFSWSSQSSWECSCLKISVECQAVSAWEVKVHKIVSGGVVEQMMFCSMCTSEILSGFETLFNLGL